MSIRKITGATSSLVTKAELQSGHLLSVKTSVQQRKIAAATATVHNTLIKSASNIQRVINHLTLSDDGSSRIVRNFVFTSDNNAFLFINKGFDDFVNAVEFIDTSHLVLDAGRTAHDYPVIGSGIDQRQDDLENISFFSRMLKRERIAEPDHVQYFLDKALFDNFVEIDYHQINLFLDKDRRDLFDALDNVAQFFDKNRTESFEQPDFVTKQLIKDLRYDSVSATHPIHLTFDFIKRLYDTTPVISMAEVFDGLRFNFAHSIFDPTTMSDAALLLFLTDRRIFDSVTMLGNYRPNDRPQFNIAQTKYDGIAFTNLKRPNDRPQFTITQYKADAVVEADRPFLFLNKAANLDDGTNGRHLVVSTDKSTLLPNLGKFDSFLFSNLSRHNDRPQFDIQQIKGDSFTFANLRPNDRPQFTVAKIATLDPDLVLQSDESANSPYPAKDFSLDLRRLAQQVTPTDVKTFFSVLGKFDSLLVANQQRPNDRPQFDITKYFADDSLAFDLANVGDGLNYFASLYEQDFLAASESIIYLIAVGRLIQEQVLIGSGIDQRQTDDEHITFDVTQLKEDNTVNTERKFFFLSRNATLDPDQVYATDDRIKAADYVRNAKDGFVESIEEADYKFFDIAKTATVGTDPVTFSNLGRADDRPQFDIAKIATVGFDPAYPIDTFIILLQVLRNVDDAVYESDAKYLFLDKAAFEDQVVDDYFTRSVTFLLQPWNGFYDLIDQPDFTTLFVNKTATVGTDPVTMLGNARSNDRPQFDITKLLQDSSAALDLTNVFDGLVYNSAIYKSDTQIVYEYLARSVLFIRGVRDGFRDTTTVSEAKYLFVDKKANPITPDLVTILGNNRANDRPQFVIGLNEYYDAVTETDLEKNTVNFVRRPWQGFAEYPIIGNSNQAGGRTGILIGEAQLESTTFNFLKFASDFNRTTSNVVMGSSSSGVKVAGGRETTPFNFYKDVKRSVAGTLTLKTIDGGLIGSSVTTVPGTMDYDAVGSVDLFTDVRTFVRGIKDGFTETLTIGNSENGRTGIIVGQAQLESATFNITLRAKDDNTRSSSQVITVTDAGTYSPYVPKFFNKDAKYGTVGSIVVKTIEFDGTITSSVSVSLTTSSTDTFGTWDLVGVALKAGGSNFRETITFGSGLLEVDNRFYGTSETVRFTIVKRFDEIPSGGQGTNIGPIMLDNFSFTDGLQYDDAKTLRDIQIVGSGATTGTRYFGSSETVSFQFIKDAKRSIAGSLTLQTIDGGLFVSSIATVPGTMDSDAVGALDVISDVRTFVRRPWQGFADYPIIGNGADGRTGTVYGEAQLERLAFTVSKFAADYDRTTSFVRIGGGATTAPNRYVGNNENISIQFTLDARRSTTSGSITFKTIDGLNDAASSVTLSAGPFLSPRTVDTVGVWDLYGASIGVGRRFFDFVTIGNVEDGRTGSIFGQAQLEALRFTLSMRARADDTGENTHRVYIGNGATTADNRFYDTSEVVSFSINKFASDFNRTTSNVRVGGPVAPSRFYGTPEFVGFDVIKDANRGTAGTLTVQTTDGGLFVTSVAVSQSTADIDAVGALDKISDVRTFVRAPRDGFDDYYVADERKYLTLLKFASDYDRTTSYVRVGGPVAPNRYYGDNENIGVFFNKTAKYGTVGNVLIKTIDSTVSEGQSSVLVTYGSSSTDIFGTYDLIALLASVTRYPVDNVTIGTGIVDPVDNRYYGTGETIRFTIGKRFDEIPSGGQGINVGPSMLDAFSFNDGITYNSTIFKRDATTIGNSVNGRRGILIGETQLEQVNFDFSKFASDFNRTTSFVLLGGAATAPQRYYGTAENVRFTTQLTAYNYDRTLEAVTPGSGATTADNRFYGTSETVVFNFSKRAKEEDGTTSNVVIGFGSSTVSRRVSGSSLENIGFNFTLDARRSTTSGSITYKTIDGLNGADSSVTITTLSPRVYDGVGIVDSFASQYLKLGTVFTDFITIGSGLTAESVDGRFYGTSETVRFTVTKRANDYDGTTSVAWIGSGATTANNRFYGSSETVVFNFSKVAKLPNATTSNVVMGFGSGALVRVSGSLREQTNFDVSLIAKAGAVTVVSGVTVSASALGDRLFIGQQYGNIRFSADPQERILFNFVKTADQDGAGSSLSFVTMGAGDNYGFRRQTGENSSETVRFTITKFTKEENGTTSNVRLGFGSSTGVRVSGSLLENTPFNFIKTAKAGISGSYLYKDIDAPNAGDSSTTIFYGPYSTDAVGIVEFYNALLFTNRFPNDFVTIGSDTGFRYQSTQNTSETVKFTITKTAGDYDGTTSVAWIGSGATTASNRFFGTSETITFNVSKFASDFNRTTSFVRLGFGSGALVRVSGSLLEQTNFDVYKTAKASVVSVVSGVTVSANANGDFLFIGQQYGGVRFGGDLMERVSFVFRQGTEYENITAGSGITQESVDGRFYGTSETVRFTIAKFAKEENGTTSNVVMGFGSSTVSRRVSGSSLENIGFNFAKTAKTGVAGSYLYKDINGVNSADSSVLLTYGPYNTDVVGIIDSYNAIFFVGRSINDFVTIGTGIVDPVDNRYYGSSETVRFTVVKRFDEIPSGGQGTNVGPTMLDAFTFTDGLQYVETKLLRDTQIIGGGATAGTRFFGANETIDFDVSLIAKAGAVTVVSGTTVSASALGDRLFVGQQYGAIRLAADPLERISFVFRAGAELEYLNAGSGITEESVDGRFYGSSETVKFTYNMLANLDGGTFGNHIVNFGSGATNGTRFFGDIETIDFDFSKFASDLNRTTSFVRLGFGSGALVRVSGSLLEQTKFDWNKYNDQLVTSADTFRRVATTKVNAGVGQTAETLEATDFIPINNTKNLNYDSVALSDSDIGALVKDFAKSILQDPNDINIVSSGGSLRSTSYADIEYFAEDYVGEKRSIF